jgi:YesN/AraC family two-component response regulator
LEIDIIGEATDRQQAVELVQKCQPDVVLMDVRMPVIIGL